MGVIDVNVRWKDWNHHCDRREGSLSGFVFYTFVNTNDLMWFLVTARFSAVLHWNAIEIVWKEDKNNRIQQFSGDQIMDHWLRSAWVVDIIAFINATYDAMWALNKGLLTDRRLTEIWPNDEHFWK